jgi:hypothetical protein
MKIERRSLWAAPFDIAEAKGGLFGRAPKEYFCEQLQIY